MNPITLIYEREREMEDAFELFRAKRVSLPGEQEVELFKSTVRELANKWLARPQLTCPARTAQT